MLDMLDHIASIATALIATLAYSHFQIQRNRRRTRLEDYLKLEAPGKRSSGDKGRRTVLHLVGALGMTEAEILDAAFNSKHIKRTLAQDPATGHASAIYLEYSAR